jgi:hypothetical protein
MLFIGAESNPEDLCFLGRDQFAPGVHVARTNGNTRTLFTNRPADVENPAIVASRCRATSICQLSGQWARIPVK